MRGLRVTVLLQDLPPPEGKSSSTPLTAERCACEPKGRVQQALSLLTKLEKLDLQRPWSLGGVSPKHSVEVTKRNKTPTAGVSRRLAG